MQLLEALVYGENNITTEKEILTECSSVLGYLECMNELMKNDAVTESVVMEGFDVKNLLKKFVAMIKGIIQKARDLFRKVLAFFNKKAKDGSSPKGSDNPNKPTETKVTDEDILAENPFTGIMPKYIELSCSEVRLLLTNVALNAGRITRKAIDYLASDREDFWFSVSDSSDFSKQWNDIKELAYNPNKVVEVLVSETSNEEGKRRLGDFITTPNDFKTAPIDIYNFYRHSTDGYENAYKTDYKFDYTQFCNLEMSYSRAQTEYKLSCVQIKNNIANLDNKLKDCDKTCTEFLSSLNSTYKKAPGSQFNERFGEIVKCIQTIVAICLNCTTQLNMGLVAFYNTVDKDLNHIDDYIKMINEKRSAEI